MRSREEVGSTATQSTLARSGDRDRAATGDLPGLSCVVIGRNEGEHLRRCFESIRAADYPADRLEIVYVDSDSTDASVAVAREHADRIVVASLPGPLPGLARNLGWPRTRHDLVHFIDGDTVINPGWFRHAVAALEDPRTFCVFGRLEEMRPHANLYHRAYNFEWGDPSPSGEPRTSGGNVLLRKSDLESLGGFDPSLEAGEEPDLCTRARLRGQRLEYLDRPMARHDMDMNTFRAWWRRGVRCGYAYSEIGSRFRHTRIPLWHEETRRNWMQLGITVAFFTGATASAGPGIAIALVGAAFLALVARKAWQSRRRGRDLRSVLAYATHTYLVKLPTWEGHLRFFLDRKLGGRDRPEARVRMVWEKGMRDQG
jgi:cellulose synthase/poly-beta-1,6-N-acetylglucosamine synthase-like glycosyltransferase